MQYLLFSGKIVISDYNLIRNFYSLLLAMQSGNLEDKSLVQIVLLELRKYVADGEDADQIMAGLASRFLNFKADSNGVVHSQYNTWQIPGGYNNAYDAIFRYATQENMHPEKFDFDVGTKEYILWAWHGDYLNIGAGCELGFYSRDKSILSKEPLDHYFVDQNLSIPMQLYLYNYYSSSNIDSIYSWQPTEKQWWITGFDPEHVGMVEVGNQIMIACANFSEFTDVDGDNVMYDEFEKQVREKAALANFVLYDGEKKTIWIMIYTGSKK
jgi:Domain of unknown function (DUF4474)